MKNLLNRVYNLKRGSAIMLGALAMVISATSSTMCGFWGFYEPEMPESMYMSEE